MVRIFPPIDHNDSPKRVQQFVASNSVQRGVVLISIRHFLTSRDRNSEAASVAIYLGYGCRLPLLARRGMQSLELRTGSLQTSPGSKPDARSARPEISHELTHSSAGGLHG